MDSYIDFILDENEPSEKGAVYDLWLHVLLLSVFELLHNRTDLLRIDQRRRGRKINYIFPTAAIREQIKKMALKKS